MPFTVKNWIDSPSTSTPLSAVALEDLETRLSDYADLHGPATSVMDPEFGVVADGSTDDTTGFGSARDAAGNGGHGYVPPGTYALNNLDLTLDHQVWELAPGAILKLKNSASTKRAVSITDAEYVTLIGGEFDGNSANNTQGGAGLIDVVGSSHIRVRDVFVQDHLTFPVRVTLSDGAVPVEDVEISGVFIDNVGPAMMGNFVGATTPSRGVRFTNFYVDNTGIAGADREGVGVSMVGPAALDDQPRECVIANGVVRGLTDWTVEDGGAVLQHVNGGLIHGVQVEGCWNGCGLSDCTSSVISTCSVKGFTDYGYEI